LISATLPHEILEMTNKFMTDPIRILVKRDELTLEVSNCCVISAAFECASGIWFKFFLSCTIPEFDKGFPSHLFMMTGNQAIFCCS
jgi:hypothetical protein